MKNRLQEIFTIFFQKLSDFWKPSFQKEVISLYSDALQREVGLEIIAAKPSFSSSPFALLLVNDGQDFAALQMEESLRSLHQKRKLAPLLVVGISAGDRMQEYGTANRPDYAGRGAKAAAYSRFIIQELIPYLQKKYSLSDTAKDRAFAGFSLGGLSAFDIVWNHPEVFHHVGVFSGALWWRSTPFDPQHPDADRIIHQQVARGPKRRGLRFWLQTGTHDETSDRNNNGIIDAIDDTLDLIAEVEKWGYQKGRDISYVEVDKGEHNPDTWRKVIPDFLLWCFGEGRGATK